MERLITRTTWSARGARVRFIAPSRVLQIPILAGIGTRTTAILRSERFHQRPGFNQRVIDTEVFIREQVEGKSTVAEVDSMLVDGGSS